MVVVVVCVGVRGEGRSSFLDKSLVFLTRDVDDVVTGALQVAQCDDSI